MIDQTAFENAIQTWAATLVSPDIVIVMEPNAPRPDKPYMGFKVNGVETVGEEDESQPDVAELVTIKSPRILVVEFQAFGSTTLTLLDKIKTSLGKNSTLELLASDNISFLSAGNINDITISLETKFESRGSLEIRFAIGSSESETVPSIDITNIDATYTGKTTVNSTINIT